MKKRSTQNIYIRIFLVISLFIIAVALYKYYFVTTIPVSFSCKGEINRKKNDERIDSILGFNFVSDKYGVVVYKGYITKSDSTRVNFGEKVFFSYKRIDNLYIMKSIKIINVAPEENNRYLFSIIQLPDFYKNEGWDYLVSVYSESTDGYIFYNDTIPFFYCKL